MSSRPVDLVDEWWVISLSDMHSSVLRPLLQFEYPRTCYPGSPDNQGRANGMKDGWYETLKALQHEKPSSELPPCKA